MKVYDILVENQKTDEGPVRFLKRTLGKNTAMGKKAQVSAEIDGEVNKLYKSFMGDLSNFNDPNPTPKNLGQWMTGKGLIANPKEVIQLLRKNPTLMNKMGAAFKGGAAATKKVAGAVAKGTKAVGKGVGAVAGKIKKAVAPQKTGVGAGAQPNLPGIESTNYFEGLTEAQIIAEITQKGLGIKLSKGEVQNIIRGAIKRNRQTMVGKGQFGGKSAYALDKDGGQKATQGDKVKGVGVNPELANALDVVKNAGYKISGKPALIKQK
jgi:hypothetical protein